MTAFLYIVLMTEEQAKAQAENWFKQRAEMTALNLRCKDLAKEFRAGKLDKLTPLWHLEKTDIDFDKQLHQVDANLLDQGYTIFPVVNFDKLLDSFYANQGSFINDKKITKRHAFVDNQLCRIIEHWQNEEPLIPPFIIFNKDLGKNWPLDGKHRMKIAYYLGLKKIPIIVPNIHLAGVSSLIL
jgi:hypothetical protein